jgi:GNAT superfamily N-acetyltransferase
VPKVRRIDVPATGASVDVPGYPVDLEHLAVLTDHREVFVRPIRPGDAAELRRALLAADYETLHERFLGSPPHDQASIRRLVEVDYLNRLALVAFAPDGSGVGVARYEGETGSPAAEVAVAVDAVWRQVGLGSLLLRELGEAAAHRGIRQFTALVLSENRPVLALLRASGRDFSVEIHSGTSDIVMLLEKQTPVATRDPSQAGHDRTDACPMSAVVDGTKDSGGDTWRTQA